MYIDRQHAKRDIVGTLLGNTDFERFQFHVALERAFVLGRQSFGAKQIQGLAAHIFDVGAGGIKMAVVGDNLPGLDECLGQYPFGSTPLVGGKNMGKPGDVPNGLLEMRPGAFNNCAFQEIYKQMLANL